MTCFWDAIIHGIGWKSVNGDQHPASFIHLLKTQNKKTDSVQINHCTLSLQEQEENYNAIQELALQDGYFCSVSDPVLCLVAELFQIQISHQLNGYTTIYQFPNATKRLELTSSKTHCSLTKKM